MKSFLPFVVLAVIACSAARGEGKLFAEQTKDAMVLTSTDPTERFTFRIPGSNVRHAINDDQIWFNTGDVVLQVLLVDFDKFGAGRGDSSEVILKKHTTWETSHVKKTFSLDKPIPSRLEKGPGGRLLSVWSFVPPKGVPTEARSQLFMTTRLNHHVIVFSCPVIAGVAEKKARSFLHSVLASLQTGAGA